MYIILLKNFNNYFNRKVINYNNVLEYIADHEYFATNDKINFNLKDGIDTEQIFNVKEKLKFVPDYCIVCDSSTNEILSKWFVMDWVKITGGQYRAVLRNDVLCTYNNEIKKGKIFVQKGMIRDPNDPFILNSEGMTYNQIKKREIPLKDESNLSWIVGYYVQKTDDEKPMTFTTKIDVIEGAEEVTPFEDVDKRLIINFDGTKKLTFIDNNAFEFDLFNKYKGSLVTKIGINRGFYDKNTIVGDDKPLEFFANKECTLQTPSIDDREFLKKMNKYANLPSTNELIDLIINKITDYKKGKYLTNEESVYWDGRLISKDGKYYKLHANFGFYKAYLPTFNIDSLTEPDIRKAIVDGLRENLGEYFYDSNSPLLGGIIGEIKLLLGTQLWTAEEVDRAEINLEVYVDKTRNSLTDAPYDMFCIPYDKNNDEVRFIHSDSSGKIPQINYVHELAIAKAIAKYSGGVGASTTLLYDLQLLPYCPIPEVIKCMEKNEDGSYTFNVTPENGFVSGKDYSLIKSTENDIGGIMFWATKSSGTFNIPYKYEVEKIDPIEKKVQNETQFIRICSPNYSGLFEMNPVKNGGIDFINVDYTYKPFNPYIHINPNFKGLYGQDFNDSRGLIVGGDFSISVITDQFATYELNNKNYQQMFDRQIVSMDVNNRLSLTQDILSGAIGMNSNALGGAMAGMMVGGPAGAIAGGVAGGVGSGLGMVADVAIGQAQYREAKAFKTDMFNYNLGNIKALPASLAKTTAFTFNNKIFPFIEEYDCTDQEKQALRAKIRYNGMTIMRVEELGKYMNNSDSFFKGQLFRLEGLGDDNHVLSVIYDELDKGVYF